jgi:prepilin-type N-terminal cleavage/methylation domain-containing protein
MSANARGKQGFTLIEAAVAIAVVAILSGIIVPLVVKNLQDSQNARAKNDVQVIAAAVASQIKDTGCRPSAAAGPGAASGAAAATWNSSGSAPAGFTASAAANTFTNLFTFAKGTAAADTMFGTTTNTEFSYKGPYLANDVAAKSDPWGSSYIILGYNATNQGTNGPIWIVCAGPDKSILAGNTTSPYPATWDATGTSIDDIVVRVN